MWVQTLRVCSSRGIGRFGSRQQSVSRMSLCWTHWSMEKREENGQHLDDYWGTSLVSQSFLRVWMFGKRLGDLCVHYDSNATLLKGDCESWLHFCWVGHCFDLWSFTKSFIVPATANITRQQTFSSPLSHVLFSFTEAGEKEKCGATETLCALFMKRKLVPSSVINKTLEGKIKGKGR